MAPAPKLQSKLWSKSAKQLKVRRDRRYIIKQLLAYGTIADLRWLTKRYPKPTIRAVARTVKPTEFHPSTHRFINLLLKPRHGKASAR